MALKKRGLIFVNGRLPGLKAARTLLQPGDLLIAVDGGSRHLQALGLTPHVLVGDLDSVEPALLEAYRQSNVRIQRYPPAKDETDLELAIQAALVEGCTSLVLVSALGGRLDHTLGNIFLLTDPALAGFDVHLDDGRVEAFLIQEQAEISGHPGDLVSLLPLGQIVQGVTTRDLQYPLHEATLYPHRTRGISNVMLGLQAGVQCRSGLLLCIHTRLKTGPLTQTKRGEE